MKVTSYDELKQIAQKFADGNFRLLIIVGPPGTSKTTIVRNILGEAARWVNASLSAFQFYLELGATSMLHS
jgi:ABC-type Mn2+/Zn2+ transport system ATPase subunit